MVKKKKEKQQTQVLTIKTPERRHSRCFAVFIVNFGYISDLFLVFLLLILCIYLFVGRRYFLRHCNVIIKNWNHIFIFAMDLYENHNFKLKQVILGVLFDFSATMQDVCLVLLKHQFLLIWTTLITFKIWENKCICHSFQIFENTRWFIKFHFNSILRLISPIIYEFKYFCFCFLFSYIHKCVRSFEP